MHASPRRAVRSPDTWRRALRNPDLSTTRRNVVLKRMAELGKELAKEPVTKELGQALEKKDLEQAQKELEKLAQKLDPQALEDAKKELEKQLAEKQADDIVDDLGDRTADLEVAIGVRVVDDRQGDRRVGLQVAVLLTAGRLAEQDVRTVPTEPHRVVLRQAVSADGGDVGESGRFEDVGVGRGNGHVRCNPCEGNDIPGSSDFLRKDV